MVEFTSYRPGTPCWVALASTGLPSSRAFSLELFGREVLEVRAGGGTVLGAPADVMDARGMAVCTDPTGAAIAEIAMNAG